jgi:XTP/dITP diphosphohydrolase
VLAIAQNGKILTTFAGAVEGMVSGPPRGFGGFGYDPVFIPGGFDKTFAELPPATKNQLSHRGRALAAALPFLISKVTKASRRERRGGSGD